MSRSLLLALALAPLAIAADKPEYPEPARTVATEPVRKAWSSVKAAEYLDAVGVNWTRDQKCVTCHTNMPYLMARPLLPHGDAGWKEVRKFLEDDVTSWSAGGKPKGDAYVVVTAAALAASDVRTGKLTPQTKSALDRMWTVQQKNGGWNWLKCDWPPLEHDDYYGATLAAVAVGIAPEKYADTDKAKTGLAKLKAYFAATPAPDLHHKLMLLWASTKLDGMMSADEQKATIAAVKKLQHADGGWCLPSLGEYKRRDKDKTPNDTNADSDGYATGLVVFVLRQAGLSADDAAVKSGVTWLTANQRESGRWFTRSLNNDKAHYITHAGTAFAVLALDACGNGRRSDGGQTAAGGRVGGFGTGVSVSTSLREARAGFARRANRHTRAWQWVQRNGRRRTTTATCRSQPLRDERNVWPWHREHEARNPNMGNSEPIAG